MQTARLKTVLHPDSQVRGPLVCYIDIRMDIVPRISDILFTGKQLLRFRTSFWPVLQIKRGYSNNLGKLAIFLHKNIFHDPSLELSR